MEFFNKYFPKTVPDAARYGRINKLKSLLKKQTPQTDYDELDQAVFLAVRYRQYETLSFLLKNRANPNCRDKDGNTPLHIAVELQSLNIVKLLINYGADVNLYDNSALIINTGYTPLSLTAKSYDNRIAKILIDVGADVNFVTHEGTALHIASSSGFKHCDNIFQKYDGNIISTLLSSGADVNKVDPVELMSPLHSAADFSHNSFAIEERYKAIVAQLIAYGADVHVRDKQGNTPLHYALKHNHKLIAELLIKSGANQKSKNDVKYKTLEERAENIVDVCRTLLGILQPTLYRDYPELLTIQDDTKFTYFGTIAFVWTACARLHFDVPKESRTKIELIVQNQLKEWHPDALNEYEKIHAFVSQKLLKETDRKKRGDLLFELSGKWVVSRVTNEEGVKGKGLEIATVISDLFLQETSGYWK